MQEAMNDPSRTYAIQLEEIYQIGLYLARAKYRWIRYAYISFISGVVTSSLSWGIVLLLA